MAIFEPPSEPQHRPMHTQVRQRAALPEDVSSLEVMKCSGKVAGSFQALSRSQLGFVGFTHQRAHFPNLPLTEPRVPRRRGMPTDTAPEAQTSSEVSRR